MFNDFVRILLRTYLLAALLLLVGCTPCDTLASLICDCEDTEEATKQCQQQVDARSVLKGYGLAIDQARCQEILDDPTCDCQAIRNKEFYKCGMTRVNQDHE